MNDFKVGDRVAYAMVLGAYAAERVLPAERAVKLPANISYEQAAGMMLKGMTAQYLLRRTFRVEKGHTILVQAAAGGVGLIVSQWANHLGATVIGTVGSKDKAAIAKANGCHHTILYREEDFAARVKEITGGKLCEVVYDGVGKATFPASLDCLRPSGSSSASAARRDRSRPSISASCHRRGRSTPRDRRSPPTSPNGRTS